MSQDNEGDVTNYLVMVRTRTEKNAANDAKSARKTTHIHIQFYELNHHEKSLENSFQNKHQTAVKGTKNIITADTEKVIHRKLISGPFSFQTDKEKTKRTDQQGKKQQKPKPSLGVRWKVYSMERHTQKHTGRKTQNSPNAKKQPIRK